jgi:hypothetical protein
MTKGMRSDGSDAVGHHGEGSGMRSDVEVRLGPGDRERLEAVLADRNSAQKHVWRARIILATAEGCGINALVPGAPILRGRQLQCAWATTRIGVDCHRYHSHSNVYAKGGERRDHWKSP